MSSLTTLRRALARASVIALLLFLLIAVVALRKALYYAAEPDGEKDCPPVVPAGADPPRPVRIRPVVPASLVWVQRGGTVNDASCLSRTPVYGVVAVREVDDVRAALAFARDNGLKVSVAGVRHSMGGTGVRTRRDRPGHDTAEPDVARRADPDLDRAERRHLARHPELSPPAVCSDGDAINRYLHRRRLDRRERPRHGSSGRLRRADDPRDARHARRRLDPDSEPHRQPAALPSDRRRLWPVWRDPGRRAGSDPQRRLPIRAPGDPVPRVPHRLQRRDRARAAVRAVVRPPLHRAALVPGRDAPLYLSAGDRPRGCDSPARRGARGEAAPARL